jgi:hypothetical protein
MSFGREEGSHRHGRRLAGRRTSRIKTPLRLLLLLIFLVVTFALLAVGALLAERSFGNDVSESSVTNDFVESGPNPNLRISTGRGTVQVEGVENLESIEFEATKHALGSDPQEARERASEISPGISKRGSTFVVETEHRRGTGTDYTVRAPRGSSVELESGAGYVEVANLHGDVMVRAGAGDVKVKDTKGSVDIQALQGDVETSEVNTDTGRVDVEVGVGDATLRDLVVGTLDVRVETGDATLTGHFSGSGQALVRTGDILVQLPPEDTRELTFEARIGDVVREANKSGQE